MEVEWTDMALAQLGDVVEYVADNFGMKYPLRHLTLAPNILYYFVNVEKDKLVILAVVHSRQSPRTINSILKRSLEQYRM